MKKLNRVIEIARALKDERQTGQHYILAAAYDGARLIGLATNNYNKQHPYHKFGEYKPLRGDAKNYRPCLHAEAALLSRLKIPTKDLTFFTVKINSNGDVGMAKPCINCQRCLNERGYRKIIYTTGNGYGVID